MVQAGHGDDGKAIFLFGLEALVTVVTDPSMIDLAGQIKQDAPNLPLHEMLKQALPIYQSEGYENATLPGEFAFTYCF